MLMTVNNMKYAVSMTHHLVGLAEIAEMLGVSRQRAHRIYQTHEDFPRPEVELTAGLIWSREAVENWMGSHPDRRQAGRRRRPS
jgi:predicted DNA-binding transcriptional regulator AlpA